VESAPSKEGAAHEEEPRETQARVQSNSRPGGRSRTETVAAISRRYKVHANQIYKWKQDLLQNMARVFEPKAGPAGAVSESEDREKELLCKIGELTVERDFYPTGSVAPDERPPRRRPSVSDDNPFSEALFRTMKYRPNYPRKPFQSFAEALQWVDGFVRWYNTEHLHSGIRYVTPADRHSRRERPVLEQRHDVYTAAQRRNPRRWTGSTRNWSPVGAVYLNPIKQEVRIHPIASPIR
jgi:transposase-like protein